MLQEVATYLPTVYSENDLKAFLVKVCEDFNKTESECSTIAFLFGGDIDNALTGE